MKHIVAKLALAVSATVLISTAATAAPTCTPPCPKGQVCAWKDANGGGGQTVCKTPIIIPNCGNDPLCGLDHGRKRPGSFQGSQVSPPSLKLEPPLVRELWGVGSAPASLCGEGQGGG